MSLLPFKRFDDALLSKNLKNCKQAYSELCSKHGQGASLIKIHLDMRLRSAVFDLCKREVSASDVQNLANFIVQLAQEDMCEKSLAVILLQDVFDVSTKQTCDALFGVVEALIVTWKTPAFFDVCKSGLLQMCNTLLKRLSQSLDASLHTRVLAFLSKILPSKEQPKVSRKRKHQAEVVPHDKLVTYKRKKKIVLYNPKVVNLSNKELTRLWNINMDNADACKAEDRNFNGVFKNVLSGFLDEIDPDQQVEEQYMKINDEKFQWMFSRHLLYNNFKEYMASSLSPSSDMQSKPAFVSTATHLKKTLFKIASNTAEYKERAAEIEAKLK